ncbi:MAG: CDP-alcohol phosphatidyltransferase family protein [Rhodobacteraceae bacterium]|jgi:phosphatidylglycerophosphate synthase|nr:CDP-alcohol phosphatidyltransferase family protein [Paracoccaceae bacterium]
MTDPAPTTERRPLKSRNAAWAARLTDMLVARRVPPNLISQASVGFAALALLCFWGATALPVPFLILGAACVQLRLVCNLLDGMVAVEGGMAAPDGPFWNEVPDRAADILILWGVGIAAGSPALGLLAGALAVATAYLREFGRAQGLGSDYSGPMAKPHRMAAVTVGALAAAAEALAFGTTWAVVIALGVILVGTAATIWRRSARILTALSQRA